MYTATSVFFFVMNWKLALSLLLVSPLILCIILVFKKKVAPMHALLREKFASMNTDAQENISGNRVVKAFAREDYEIDKFDKANVDYRETGKKTHMTWITFFPYVETIVSSPPIMKKPPITRRITGRTFTMVSTYGKKVIHVMCVFLPVSR